MSRTAPHNLVLALVAALLAVACSEPEVAPATISTDTAVANDNGLGVNAGQGSETTSETNPQAGQTDPADSAAIDVQIVDVGAVADTSPAKDTAAADVAKPKPIYTPAQAHCGNPAPAGSQLAAAPKKYAGTCPKLVTDGTTKNKLTSSGAVREFVLLAPADVTPTLSAGNSEKLPVLFAWHWLKGSAKSFVEKGEFAKAVNEQRFIAIVPESKNDIIVPIPLIKSPISFPWPMLSLIEAKRVDEEHAFFDDMLACVAEQLPIDKECVSLTGVSAGALYGAQLASARSEHIASYISLSGGVQSSAPFVNSFLIKWPQPKHKMPMMVLWGGPNDSCALLNFEAASQALEAHLDSAGAFLVECIHNCGHGVPPVDAEQGKSQFAALWDFAFSHPYWLPVGQSPWAKQLPAAAPSWCAIGSGTAKIRTGACGEPSCPL